MFVTLPISNTINSRSIKNWFIIGNKIDALYLLQKSTSQKNHRFFIVYYENYFKKTYFQNLKKNFIVYLSNNYTYVMQVEK